MPCVWRCSWKTLTWSEVLPSNLTKNGFHFWRFGFFAETFATAQRFAKSGHKLCVCLCLNSFWLFSTTGKGGIEKKKSWKWHPTLKFYHLYMFQFSNLPCKLDFRNGVLVPWSWVDKHLAINLQLAEIVRGMSLSKLAFEKVHFIRVVGPSCKRRYQC